MVKVPDVAGKPRDEAIAELEGLLAKARERIAELEPGSGKVNEALRRLGARVELAEAATSRCTLENEGLSSHRRDPSSGRIAGIVAPVPGAVIGG